MRKLFSLVLFLILAGSTFAQDIPYKTGSWNGDDLGNHRAVVRVESAAEYAPDDPIPFEPGKGWLLILE